MTFPGNFIGISGRERVSIEGMDFELEKLPVTAHSPWDMLVYMPAFDLMFTGDLVVNEPILYLEHCDIQNWVNGIGRNWLDETSRCLPEATAAAPQARTLRTKYDT